MAQPGAGDGNDAPNAATDTEGGQAAAPGPGPWASDLERFPEEVRGDVDAYLREKWQPHTTQLEQRVSEFEGQQLPEGQRLFWEHMQEDPDNTVVTFLSQLYGEESQPYWEKALEFATAEEVAAGAVQASTEGQPEGAFYGEDGKLYVPADGLEVSLPEEDQAVLDAAKASADDTYYSESVKGLRDSAPDDFPTDWTDEQVENVMQPFIVAAPEELDDEQALAYAHESYKATYSLIHGGAAGTEQAAAAAAAGLSPEQVAAINASANGPATLSGGGHAAPPTEPEYASIGDAMTAWRNERAAARGSDAPPVV